MISLNNGFDEATAIVLNLDDSIARLCAAFNYRLIWRGASDPATLSLMGVDPTWQGEEALVGDTAQGRGNIRLFAFPGHPTGVMRDGAQPWDSGGIFDINIRALGPIEDIHRGMVDNGFCAFGPITAWDFGPLAVKEVLSRDADGVCIAVMERVSPPLEGYDNASGPASYVFNSTQIVADFDAARAFYVDALGWKVVQESTWVHPDGRNCMGFPIDVARTRELRVGIYQSEGLNEGSIEICAVGGETLDYSRAAPPERGWAALRFPMSDMSDFLTRAEQGGATILPPRTISMEPYGKVDAAAIITPWGARFEAFVIR